MFPGLQAGNFTLGPAAAAVPPGQPLDSLLRQGMARDHLRQLCIQQQQSWRGIRGVFLKTNGPWYVFSRGALLETKLEMLVDIANYIIFIGLQS